MRIFCGTCQKYKGKTEFDMELRPNALYQRCTDCKIKNDIWKNNNLTRIRFKPSNKILEKAANKEKLRTSIWCQSLRRMN